MTKFLAVFSLALLPTFAHADSWEAFFGLVNRAYYLQCVAGDGTSAIVNINSSAAPEKWTIVQYAKSRKLLYLREISGSAQGLVRYASADESTRLWISQDDSAKGQLEGVAVDCTSL